ncbi:hypothetical protein GSI_04509 [Ganoderma sinense ZZ0214-1]|uniref:Uncharacterized protein n=1 Tax=Ganoderma sinense ZZ0214-1 TaxID=1077348 RepID=A0A2G8SH09_9APHY|nr:hypothetical protein GSI_04509 [Ganoderma sinense ZZ0214-1]
MTFLASNPDISDTIAQYTAAFSDNCFLFAVVGLEGMEVERRSINVADTFGSLSIIIDPADWDDDHDDGGVDYPLATFDASPSPDEGGAAN